MRDDFNEFPPLAISEKILQQVREDLNPNVWKVFSKLSVIHFFTALVTLTICPQFGIQILSEGMGLMHIFMLFGTLGCMLACGFFFLGTSLFSANLLLCPEDLKVIRENKWIGLVTLTSLSLGFFIMLDAEFILNLALAWMVGSVLGGVVILELGWSLSAPRFKRGAQ